MSQFTVYRNKSPRSKGDYPFLLDIQSDLLSDLKTRVVIPLCSEGWLGGQPIGNLVPKLEIEGDPFLVLTPQLAGVSTRELGERVTDLSESRDAIIAALDLLITGV